MHGIGSVHTWLIDINGDGIADYVTKTNDGGIHWNASLLMSDPIKQIAVPGIFNIVIEQKSLSQPQSVYTKDTAPNTSTYPRADLQIPMQVVSSVSSSNGVGGTNTVSYQYGGLKAENATTSVPGSGRGMLGFRWMKSKEEATGIESYTQYSQDWPTIGAPTLSETRLSGANAGAGNGGVLKRSATTYRATTGSASNTTFVFPASSIEESWDLNGVQLPTITSSYEYAPSGYEGSDGTQYGDPSRIVVNTSHGGSDVGRKLTVNTYAPAITSGAATASWILGRLKRASVTSQSNPGSFTAFAPPAPPPAAPSIVWPSLVAVLPASAAVSYTCGTQYNFSAYASVSGGSGGYQYSWSNSNPTAVSISASGSGATLSTNIYGTAGQSSVQVTVTDNGGRSTQSNILQISATVDGCYDPGGGYGGWDGGSGNN